MSRVYLPTTNIQLERNSWIAYGPFAPDTMARTIRWENADLGLKTCGNPYCLKGFKAESFTDADGKRHRPGRGLFYCSRACVHAARSYKDELFGRVTLTDENGAEL